MSPKFRGDAEDWLDEEEGEGATTSASKPKKAPQGTVKLSPDEANAVVAEVFPSICRVELDEGGGSMLCSYRRAGVFGRGSEVRERSPVAVGDLVKVSRTSVTDGVVEGVCERRNQLSRPAPGRDTKQQVRHVIASNVDELVIVASVASPDFNSGLVDRYLVAAGSEGIPALLCVTKADMLCAGGSRIQSTWELYRELGYEVIEVSAHTGTGIEVLRERLSKGVSVFCGKSGVGKTSLLRVLLGSDFGRVGAVSDATGKGQHTTTGAVLIGRPSGARWIDTPGIREFGLEISPEELAALFPEFGSLECTSHGCMHDGGQGCGAGSLVRFPSYLRILESLRAGEG
jgi:ribosome biogenesis GTPase / thiamine phosphate phosphatase